MTEGTCTVCGFQTKRPSQFMREVSVGTFGWPGGWRRVIVCAHSGACQRRMAVMRFHGRIMNVTHAERSIIEFRRRERQRQRQAV